MVTCSRCGRSLTDPRSIDRRMGPVCATKEGMLELDRKLDYCLVRSRLTCRLKQKCFKCYRKVISLFLPA
ncbi:MAG: DUF6011 domain-containing protein [Candidatus Hodarchaeota archaeon]